MFLELLDMVQAAERAVRTMKKRTAVGEIELRLPINRLTTEIFHDSVTGMVTK